MAQGLNNLIKKYYKNIDAVDRVFDEILECCSYEITNSIARYELKDREEMEQEARIKIYNLLTNHKLDKVIDSSDEDIASYLKVAIDNSLRDKKRKESNTYKHEYTMPFNELENIADLLDEIFELKSSFEEAFNKVVKVLTKKQKEVMKLIYLEGLKEKEIAELLDMRRQTVNGLKNRAKKVIKANLTQKNSGAGQTPIFEVVV
ncbi:MAG: RNA polymerase sigma factor [Cetobacterium sp.]|uniref:RNA polymerase sigma factor n=1 Tax=Cetobacterium sp. TaxID=2071632 RepID=UPI003F2C8A67